MAGAGPPSAPDRRALLRRAVVELRALRARVEAVESAAHEPIAIVGLGCRFPGGASDPAALWRLLRDGVDAIREVPPERWDAGALYDTNPAAPGKMTTRWGGFLDHVDGFDAEFFGMSAREAAVVDPQQRLLLEVAWEALELAGLPAEALAGSPTGVFVGISGVDYVLLQAGDLACFGAHTVPGAAHSIAANRLSYLLDLKGPSLAVDTACSSSLVAVHLACQALRRRECDLALAGGVSLMLSPHLTVGFSKAGMMSADGRCKTFDARADGYVRGEGCGLVVLKRLADARAGGDPVWAVVAGSAVNQDGRTAGLTAPSGRAQEAVIRAALADARLEPAAVDYVEAHGTGTALGDPIEMEVLSRVFGAARRNGTPCRVGSLKTNFGHLEAAAGIAGLMKAVLAMRRGEIPPHLHLTELNPHIVAAGTALAIPTSPQSWAAGAAPRCAGVSSFGFGGANAHVVLTEAPPPASGAAAPAEPVARLLPLSARHPDALRALAKAYGAVLRGGAGTAAEPPDAGWADVCHTAAVRRTHHRHRLAVLGDSPQALAERLEAFARGEAGAGVASGAVPPGARRRLVLVFSGQGTQWATMGCELVASEPVFAAALEEFDAAFRHAAGWSVLDALRAPAALSRLDETLVAQPAIVGVQLALAALWRSWGVVPDAVVGHSVGEIAAACVAGVLDVAAAANVAFHRGRVMQPATGRGRMVAVGLTVAEAERHATPFPGAISVAAHNGPALSVLAGEPAPLEALVAGLEAAGVRCRWVPVAYAFHSHQMEPFCGELTSALAGLTPRPATLPIVSTVTGDTLEAGAGDAAYWARNLRERVRFAEAVGVLAGQGHDLFLEVGGHPVLGSAVRQTLHAAGRAGATILGSLQKGEPERATLLASLGRLYAQGWPVDWQGLSAPGARCVTLPSYPWQRRRLWLPPAAEAPRRAPVAAASGSHALLGPRVATVGDDGTRLWELDLGGDAAPYLKDHRVDEALLFPAAGYVDLALAAAADAFGPGPHVLEDLVLERALVLPEGAPVRVQLTLRDDAGGAAIFRLFSGAPSSWTLHASARVRAVPAGADGGADAGGAASAAPRTVRERCPEHVTAEALYAALAEIGFAYGERFRRVAELWRCDGEAIARLAVGPGGEEPRGHRIHPTLLDAAFHGIAAAVAAPGSEATSMPYLPVSARLVRVHAEPTGALWAHVRLLPGGRDGREHAADVFIVGGDGRLCAEVRQLRLRRSGTLSEDDGTGWFFRHDWQGRELPPEGEAVRGTWLVFADRAGTGERVAQALEARGGRAVRVVPGALFAATGSDRFEIDPTRADDVTRLLGAVSNGEACRGIVHGWSLDIAPPSGTTAATLEAARAHGCESVLHLVQAVQARGWREAPRLWLLTRGAQAVGEGADPSPAQAPLWGLGKVVAWERPELRCTLVDLDPKARPEETGAELHAILAELLGDDGEREVAHRAGRRLVARLAPLAPPGDGTPPPLAPAGERAFRLEIDRPGILDHLSLRALPRRAPMAGEVEVAVRAAGLNFKDVLLALGVVPEPSGGPVRLGGECAGVVTAIGRGVTTVAVGDPVVAVAPHSLGRFVTTPAELVVRKPAHLTWEEAAGLPFVFMTAHHALHHLARLRPGERVLVHAATGGVGLAAVGIAQRAGAEVFATAGSPEKREFLAALGVRHVMDSRSLAFADEVMARTAGEGVDVVLNSLAGDAIARNLAILRPHGRMLEIGVRDILADSRLGLAPFQKNLAFFAIDLARMAAERPGLFAELLREVMERLGAGVWPLPPVQVFPVSAAGEAFRHMAKAKHIGKIVIALDDPERVPIAPAAERCPPVRGDATYLVTGGLGGLGLAVARWLVGAGARHLVLLGRSAPAAAAREAVDELERAGATVKVAQADVADPAGLAAVLAGIGEPLPPLRGVVHAAGVLEDGLLATQDGARLRAVMSPKVTGAWNLHEQTAGLPLDFFVLFSSAASLLGSPGQGGYPAANAFLDALAHHRRARGLPALAVDWGPWGQAGMAAADGRRGRRLDRIGLKSLPSAKALDALGVLLARGAVQAGVMALDLGRLRRSLPHARSLEGVLAGAEVAAAPADGGVRARLLAVPPGRARHDLLVGIVQQQLGQVLGVEGADLDPQALFQDLGLDSLLALDLEHRLEASLGVVVSAATVFNHRTIAALAPYLAARLKVGLDEADDAPPPDVDDESTDDDEDTARALRV